MSLFDNLMDAPKPEDAPSTTEEASAQPNPDAPAEPGWWLDDNIPGQGDRPQWLPDKYKKVSDVAKAYGELQKRLGVAPEKYDFKTAESWLDPDYEPIIELAEYAKSKHVTQDVLDKMLSTVGKYLDEFKVDYEEEKKLLGDNAKERLQTLNNWAKANLSEDSYFALTSNMRSADSVKAIEELRQKMIDNNTTIPTGKEDLGEPPLSISDIEQEMAQNLTKYQTDARYRAELSRKFELALEREKK